MDPSNLVISPLRISTMVITAHMGTGMNLQTLLECFHERAIPLSWPEQGLLKVEYKPLKENKAASQKIVVGTCSRDELTKRRKSTNIFFNQSTLVVRRLVEPGLFKEVNIKLFKNGGIQMTGIPSEQFAHDTIDWLAKELQGFSRPVFVEKPAPTRFAIQLINSDYSVNGTIHREHLHSILTQRYNLFSSFESTIYQGCDTKYFYNEALPAGSPEGICACADLCTGSGDGKSLGACKIITISPFHTGSIIITGARSFKQIETAYIYINKILRKHCSEIIKPHPPKVEKPAKAPKAAKPAKPVKEKMPKEKKEPKEKKVPKEKKEPKEKKARAPATETALVI